MCIKKEKKTNQHTWHAPKERRRSGILYIPIGSENVFLIKLLLFHPALSLVLRGRKRSRCRTYCSHAAFCLIWFSLVAVSESLGSVLVPLYWRIESAEESLCSRFRIQERPKVGVVVIWNANTHMPRNFSLPLPGEMTPWKRFALQTSARRFVRFVFHLIQQSAIIKKNHTN